MKKLLLLITLIYTSLYASTSLEVYTNTFFLKQNFISPKQINVKLPLHVKLENIRYELSSNCEIKSESISQKKKLFNGGKNSLKKLEDEKEFLDITIDALESKKRLLASLSLKDESDFSKIERISDYLEKNIITIESKISTTNKKISKIDKEISKLTQKVKEYKNLQVSFICKSDNANVSIAYPIQSIEYTPFYEIYANTKSKTLHLLSKTTITQNELEDLKGIDINIYSNAFNTDIKPRIFYPNYLKKRKRVSSLEMAAAPRTMMAVGGSKKRSYSKNKKIVRKTLNNIYSYTIPNVDLLLNKKSIITLDNENIETNFSYLIDGYGSNKAYLKASFKPTKTYKNGEAKLFLNSMPIAKTYIKTLREKDKNVLYFGENQFISIKGKLIETEDESSFFAGETSTQKWQYTIANNNSFSTDIEFITRTPVSKDGDIKVTTIAEPKFTKQRATGKTIWEFTLKHDEVKKILFGYTIQKSE